MQRLWLQRDYSWVWPLETEGSLPPSNDNHKDLPDCVSSLLKLEWLNC
jgi:hypothetical protein